MVAYIDNYIYSNSSYYQNYSRTKCLRDTGLIVDALVLDLLFGGTSQSDFAGLQYWNQNGYVGLIPSELTTTTAAINFISSLSQQIVQNSTNGTRSVSYTHLTLPTILRV